uniref:Uncharacterized protein n=1 Tax=Arundo donax TaxID=35708 RepID=A0A0A8ZBE6_ARUDO
MPIFKCFDKCWCLFIIEIAVTESSIGPHPPCVYFTS